MNKIMTVALKEFRDGLRNRWILVSTLIFTLFAVGLAYFGSAVSGQIGFSSVPSTITSLSSLAVIVIPLIALMLSYDAFVGEREQGTLLLLLTYPLSKIELLAGKFIGHGLMLAIAIVTGFGLAALMLGLGNESLVWSEVLNAFAYFIVAAILLGWSFIAIALLISLVVREKSQAAGLALIVWFLFVLVFDLALLATLVASDGALDENYLRNILLLNPTDVFRLINYLALEARAETGVLSLAGEGHFNLAGLLAVLSAWVALPLIAAGWVFKRQSI